MILICIDSAGRRNDGTRRFSERRKLMSNTKNFAVLGAKPAGLAVHSSNHAGVTAVAYAWK